MAKHPDEEIEREYHQIMNEIAGILDHTFNGDVPKEQKKTCFALLITSFDELKGEGRCNYISNGERKDIITMMKEFIARAEGMAESKGHA